MKTIVFCSGTWDCLHPGHIKFFKEASKYGELYVGVGNDESVITYKGKKPVFNENERLYMVKAVRYVSGCWINSGQGQVDWLDDWDSNNLNPDILIVNEDQDNEVKRQICEHRGIKYIVLKRIPEEGLPARSTTEIRKNYATFDNN